MTVPARTSGSAVQYVDPKAVDFTMASRWLAQQNSGGAGRVFAGRQLRFNGQKGVFTEYVNKADKKKKDLQFVLNVANAYAAWQYWPEGSAPSYPHIIPIFGDVDAHLPSRASVGPHEVKFNKLRKEEEDVWSEVPVLILRDAENDQIYHWIGTGISQRMAITIFLQENADEFARHKGKLPLVELGVEEAEGKEGGSYERPTITIVDWVKPTAMDNPQGLASSVVTDNDDDEEEDDEPKATVKSRSAKKSARDDDDEDDDRPKKSARDDDDDEDEDEDEEDAPTTKALVKARKARQESARKRIEEEEDDLPKSRKRAVTVADDDEDDEDAAPPRRGRRGR